MQPWDWAQWIFQSVSPASYPNVHRPTAVEVEAVVAVDTEENHIQHGGGVTSEMVGRGRWFWGRFCIVPFQIPPPKLATIYSNFCFCPRLPPRLHHLHLHLASFGG